MEEVFEKRAKEAKNGEELHIVSDATTENFNKITMHLLKWISQMAGYIMDKKGFRLVVEYEPKAESTKVSFYEKSAKVQSTEEFLADLKAYFRSEEHQQSLKHFADCCRDFEASRDSDLKASEQS